MANPASSALPPRRLISSSKIAGTAVFDLHGKKLGHIDDVMIDKSSGRVAYAVLAFGGFLGINDKHHPLPWSALRYDVARDGYVVDLEETVLKAAPAYPTQAAPDWEDRSWEDVDDYYDTRPVDQDEPLDATTPAR
jgi:hypothetical protein